MTTLSDLLIDTDILIDVARNIPEAISYVKQKEQQYQLTISTITHMELLIGARNKTEQRKIERFIRRFQIRAITEAISILAVDLLRTYRLSHGLLIADACIAATALTASIPLASKNQRDYRFIAQLVLLQ